MTDYAKKTYGRNKEVAKIFGLFKAGKDVSKHGPRRLGCEFRFKLDMTFPRFFVFQWAGFMLPVFPFVRR